MAAPLRCPKALSPARGLRRSASTWNRKSSIKNGRREVRPGFPSVLGLLTTVPVTRQDFKCEKILSAKAREVISQGLAAGEFDTSGAAAMEPYYMSPSPDPDDYSNVSLADA